MKLHLIGVGDYNITSIIPLEDPCPLPGNSSGSGGQCTGTGIDNGKPKKISLKNKDILLYAPMANIGRVQMNNNDSKDGGLYIEIKDIHYTKKEMLSVGTTNSTGTGIGNRKNRSSDNNEYDIHTDNDSLDDDEDGEGGGRGEGVKNDEYKYKGTPMGLLRDMQDVSRGVDQLMEESEMTLFPGSQPVRSSQMDAANKGEDEEEEGGQVYDSDDEEDDDDEDGEWNDGDEGEGDSDAEEEEEEGDSDDDEEGEGDEGELLGDDDYDNMDAEDDDGEADEDEDQPYTTTSSTGTKSKPTPTTTAAATKRTALPSYNKTTSGEVKSQAVSAYLQRLKDSQSKDLMRRVSYISSIFRAYIYAYIYVYMCIP